MDKKVLIFGIDGGNYQSLNPWLNSGSMPFLRNFLMNNFSMEIKCEIDNALGWPTFMTGQHPKHHLAYYWMGRNYQAKNDNFFVNSTFFGNKTLWHALSDKGISCALINVPFTFPPMNINGFVISGPGGGLKHNPNLKITYPESLMDQIKSHGIDYRMKWFDVNSMWKATAFVNNVIEATESHIEAASYLMNTYDISVLMIVFRGHDAMQHRTSNLIESNGIKKHPKLEAAIEQYYRTVDGGMNRLYQQFSSTNCKLLTLIASDHGFGPCLLKVNIDQIFKANRWLSYNYSDIVPRILRRLKVTSRGSGGTSLDMSKTKVYRDSTNSVSINLKGRDAHGIVDKADYRVFRSEVITFLKDLQDPRFGKIFKRISTPEELDIDDAECIKYGKYFPDIVFSPSDFFAHG